MIRTGINMNFNSKNRKAEYPKLEDVKLGTDSDIIKWIENLPAPSNPDEITIFNEVLNQFHCMGGKI